MISSKLFARRAQVKNIADEKSQFQKECELYEKILFDIEEKSCMGMNPLEFWPTYKTQIPVHARLAVKLLSAPATTENVERLFSLSGRILSNMRSRLTPDHVNELTCLKNQQVAECRDG